MCDAIRNASTRPNASARRRGAAGTSFLELMVALTVILVLVAIALPNLEKARRQAEQASAAASVRAILEAQEMYAGMYPSAGYADQLSKLRKAGIISEQLGCSSQPCLKDGYEFYIFADQRQPVTSYVIIAADAEGSQPGRCVRAPAMITACSVEDELRYHDEFTSAGPQGPVFGVGGAVSVRSADPKTASMAP